MQRIFLFTALLLCSSCLLAQAPATDSVKATINKMFLAMKNGDAVSLKSCFTDSAIMQTIAHDRNGNALVKNESVSAFTAFVGTLPQGAADERIRYDAIRVDGALAMAWTPYQFYLNGRFSHCGANSFQLVRTGGEWKIQYIVDTRRKQGCAE
jgi:hypothetical protein